MSRSPTSSPKARSSPSTPERHPRYPSLVPPPSNTPTIAAVLNQADLEVEVGVDRLPKLILRSTSERASTEVFAARVLEICQGATDRAAGILFQAFSATQIATLFASDMSIWLDVRGIGAGLCGLYQTELVDPETGTYPFSHRYKTAVADLMGRVKGEPRAIGEVVAGNNRTVNVRGKKIPCIGTFTGRRAF